jgi:hypothetical protein
MKFSAAAVLAAVAGAHAWSNVTYTTEVVTALTTYCPAATEITHGGTTYTVTEVRTRPEGIADEENERAGMSRKSIGD